MIPIRGLRSSYVGLAWPAPAERAPVVRRLPQSRKGIRYARWSAEDDAHLRTLWAEGVTGRAIGEVLGRSKGAVIGRVFRLRLEQRPNPTRRGKS